MPHPADAAHIRSPLATQIGQLDEAAALLARLIHEEPR